MFHVLKTVAIIVCGIVTGVFSTIILNLAWLLLFFGKEYLDYLGNLFHLHPFIIFILILVYAPSFAMSPSAIIINHYI